MYTDKEILIQLGRNIKAERVRRGYTLEYFAEKIGFTREYISRIERGQENMSIIKINNLANILETNITDLLKF